MSARPWFRYASLPFVLLLAAVLPGDAVGPDAPREARVVGLPAGYDAAASARPYSGPHPARLTRPPETFVFPIRPGGVGPAEPLFAGPRQYPFICDTDASGLGPPLVDNHDGVGTPVAPVGGTPDRLPVPGDAAQPGFSADCLARTRAEYYYAPRRGTGFVRWSPQVVPDDIAQARVAGRKVPFVVRVETGTINRFIYLIAALRGPDEAPDAPGAGHWNRRLVYQFHGGVGIGHRQGKVDVAKLLAERREQLALGYALATSTGNATTNHFNIWLAEDTALRVKRQFAALYGAPEFTIGVGGSGGAIQQYLLAQNRPGIIDGAIAQYGYPDMVTQTIPVFDCELLEHYFDVTDADNPLWRAAEHRQWIEGLKADNAHEAQGKAKRIATANRLAHLARGQPYEPPRGNTECVVGWRGLTPLVLNPRFAHFGERVAPAVYDRVYWSHFEDLKRFYGTDATGHARVPWDNVGVQYGLQALRRGQIDPGQFLRLNARIGTWKAPSAMRQERYWMLNGAASELAEFSPWSAHNMELDGDPAPRRAGDTAAIAAAFRSGQVFLGRLDIPVIDVRHYLDPELNMHHASASFSVRLRLLAAQGHADNHALWVAAKPHDPTSVAFRVMEEWLQARRAAPGQPWAASRPVAASDRCFDDEGGLIAQGESVWHGPWNGAATGPCLAAYPIYGNSRTEAGDTLHGDRFRCALEPVAEAIARGAYAPIDMAPHRAELERVFPQGVCDYRLPDPARPRDPYGGAG